MQASEIKPGDVLETLAIPDKGLPEGTLVKVIRVKGDCAHVRRASGDHDVIHVKDLRPAN